MGLRGRGARPQRRHRRGLRAPRSWSSTPASCSAAAARTRSTRSSSSSAPCASGSRARAAACRSASRSWAASATSAPLDDVIAISARLGWVRPVLDFAHMHATSDGAFTDVDPFAAALEAVDEVLEPGCPVPHPLLGHPVRQPQRDEAPALRRGHAPRRAAARGARALRAPRDRDQRVAGRGQRPGDPGRAQRALAGPEHDVLPPDRNVFRPGQRPYRIGSWTERPAAAIISRATSLLVARRAPRGPRGP